MEPDREIARVEKHRGSKFSQLTLGKYHGLVVERRFPNNRRQRKIILTEVYCTCVLFVRESKSI